MVPLTIGFKTDIGRRRDTNQDSYAVLRRSELNDKLDALVVVADGMGGMRGGEIASGIVAQSLPEAVCDFLAERNGREDAIDTARLLRDLLSRANRSVWERQAEQSELRGMGTTCVAAIVQGDLLTVGNVGDSRAYMLREGLLRQITEDHSEVWEEVKAGRMTREQARRSRYRNVITRAIGLQPDVKADVQTLPLEAGDTVLICSDGLTTEVEDAEIARILATVPDAQEACDRLVEAALENGGSDNITVVVLRYGPFTPLMLPEEEDEETTDPNQDWRDVTRSPVGDRNLSIITTTPRREAAPRRSRSLFWVGLGFLLLAALAEAAGGYFLLKRLNAHPLPPKPSTPVVLQKPTDQPLVYGKPVMLLAKPFRDDYLLLDAGGNAIVVALSGAKLRVSPKGEVTQIPGSVVGGANGPGPPRVYMALDPSGNLYQTNPITRSIEKYKPDGTRIAANIGKRWLRSPAALQVDTLGNIYVLDDHRLKEIPASSPSH
ncbi:MAG TPA: Stp1/IreP family PP2C-type Ser/Thr phosphatase [Chthonomonadaceae bacterium]|nr:Stp1/IreP family PP2C-type Ser/Thr phosphatase [Chthonomonadaceae bacterium]